MHLRVDKFSEQISEVPLQSLSEQERAEDRAWRKRRLERLKFITYVREMTSASECIVDDKKN